MKKKFKSIPKFKNEDEERNFWATADTSEYFDWSKGVHMTFPNLKLTTRPITIRLPAGLIDRIKIKANKMDIPYQTYIKQLLFNSINQ